MKRLDAENLTAFIEGDGLRVVLFAAPTAATTMAQAEAFADAWAANPHARFGYIDATQHDAIKRALDVQHLPTTLVFCSGAPGAAFEGLTSCHAICDALQTRRSSSARTQRRVTFQELAA